MSRTCSSTARFWRPPPCHGLRGHEHKVIFSSAVLVDYEDLLAYAEFVTYTGICYERLRDQ